MGMIDQTTFTFSCPACKTSEVSRARQRGSAYGASWGPPSAVKQFIVEWSYDGFAGPVAERAKCAACSGPAEVKTSH